MIIIIMVVLFIMSLLLFWILPLAKCFVFIPAEPKENTRREKRPFYQLLILGCLLFSVVVVVGYHFSGGWKAYQQSQKTLGYLPLLRLHAMNPNAPQLTTTQMQELARGVRLTLLKQPDQAMDWLLLGDVYTALRDHHNALFAFERAYQLHPQDLQTQFLFGQALLRSPQRYRQHQGVSLLEGYLQIYQDDISVLSTLAFYAYSQKQYDQAIEYWQRILPFIESNVEREQLIKRSIQMAREERAQLNNE